jgi:limonene 1,2-monooxygenase
MATMRFGIFSNGWRHATVAADTYDRDLAELVLADRLGFDEAWISEHIGGPNSDVVPVPELLIAKASGLTSRIRLGCAVRLLPLYHPIDVATSAAMCDQLLRGRYMFGFGPGIPFTGNMERRGLAREDRHAMLRESVEFIQRCWCSDAPFDWEGTFWRGTEIAIDPKPFQDPHPPLAIATASEDMVREAAAELWRLMVSHHDPANVVRERASIYAEAADGEDEATARDRITIARSIYVGESTRAARDEFRPDLELHLREQRAFNLHAITPFLGEGESAEGLSADRAMQNGMFTVGDPDHVVERLTSFFEETGGFGTLLLVMGKDWGPDDGRARSMRLFIEEVAPRLPGLELGVTASVTGYGDHGRGPKEELINGTLTQ